MKEYNTHNPTYELIACIDGDMRLEKKIHETWQPYLYKLEWFHYTMVKDLIEDLILLNSSGFDTLRGCETIVDEDGVVLEEMYFVHKIYHHYKPYLSITRN